MPDDALDKLMAQLFAVAPELGGERIRNIAQALRRDMGGTKLGYVRKEPVAGKARALAEGLAAGASLREASRSLGFCLRTAQRLIHRGWVRTY
jgi:hypothetical protein